MCWGLFGWLTSWQKFYLEHIVSNFNYMVYGVGMWQIIVAVLDDSTWQSYLGLVLYMFHVWSFWAGEWRLGTDALRALDKNYYADPRFYPSMLYLFGLKDHDHFPEDPFLYYEEEAENRDDRDIEIVDKYEDKDEEEIEIEEENNDEFDEDSFNDLYATL